MRDQFIKDVFYYGKFHEESLEKAKKEVEYIVKYKENYLNAYFCTKKAFLKADPIGIAFMDWYEYDPEIVDMASRLQTVEISQESVQKIAKEVLDRWFGGEHEEYGRKLMEAFMPCYEEIGNKLFFSEGIEELYREYHQKLKCESESKVDINIVL